MKNFIFKLITVVFVFSFALIAGEIVFRLTKPNYIPLEKVTQTSNKHLLAPNSIKEVKSSIEGEFDVTARINSFGYRGKDFVAAPVEGVKRIFAVGDSFTFGVGAQDDETIPYLLEQELNKRGDSVEVINAGVGHTSPIVHYINLRDIHLQYKPDIVVLLFDLTDLWDDWHWERMAIRGKGGEIVRFDPTMVNGKKSWWKECIRSSALCKYLNNKIVRTWDKIKVLGLGNYLKAVVQGKRAKAVIATTERNDVRSSAIEYDGLLMMRGRERKDLIDEHWPRTEGYLLKIKELLAQHNIPLVIVMYPHGLYVGGDQWGKGRVFWGFEEGKTYTDYYGFELVEDFARRNQIPFINTLPDFLSAPKDRKYFFDFDGHLTPEGNKIVAESLATKLSAPLK